MRLETALFQRQEMKLKLAPQIIQSIEILQLPTLALQELVNQEMLENPTLELQDELPAEDGDKERADEAGEERAEAEPTKEAEAAAPDPEDDTGPSVAEIEREFERLDDMGQSWAEARPPRSRGTGPDGEDKKLEALQNTAARAMGLHEHLLGQVHLLVDDERGRTIAEHLVYSIDDATGWLGYRENGVFIPHDLEELGASMDQPATLGETEEVLRIIQSLEPPGVGARNLTECLLLQVPKSFTLERRLIERHLDDLKLNRLPKVAHDTGRSIEEIKEAIEYIAQLNPHPGALFGSKQTSYVVPDVVCELVDGEYVVRLDDSFLPRVHISKHYRQLLHEQHSNRAVRDYIKKKIDSAKWLIDSIQQRQSTLFKISNEICRHQRPFLDKGLDALRPLKMQEIADRVGVHVSTVSRAIADKWMQTPQGVHPLRYFFNGGTTNANGDEESILAVKQKVRDVIDKEDKRKPLSDEEIAKELKKLGYHIARRTVTKYRKQMRLLSSRQRREY